MLEAFLLAGYVFILSPVFYYFKVPPIWIFSGMLIFSLPGIYAMVTGAPFVPTPSKTLKKMIELAKVKKGENVFDLGCGDGRIVFAAAAEGAKAVGYELSVPTFLLARFRSLFKPKAKILYRNFWSQDYRNADVIFCFLLTDTMQKFYQHIWPQLKPGCRVVSNAFKIKNLNPQASDGQAVLYVKK